MLLELTPEEKTDFPEINAAPKPYWRIIVNERTQMKFSDLFTTKNEVVELNKIKKFRLRSI
jgi:hypothetical protein